MGQAMQDVVWALGASIIPNIEGLSGQLGSTLVYTQDAGTGGLIVVVERDRQEKETESERKREEKGGGGSHPSALCESFGVAHKA